jgi:ABC-2 type transport system ATP-binding protein
VGIVVRPARKDGVTIILTTHYIEEAEAIADRVGVIDGAAAAGRGEGGADEADGAQDHAHRIAQPLDAVPESLARYELERAEDGLSLTYVYDTQWPSAPASPRCWPICAKAGIVLRDIQTTQSSLEEIFVDLVREGA